MAFDGLYQGLFDGKWGKGSQRALNAYLARKDLPKPAVNWHVALLAIDFFDEYEKDGWKYHYLEKVGLSILLPFKNLDVGDPSEHFMNFHHRYNSLGISVGIHSTKTAQGVHDFTAKQHDFNDRPYSVRKSNRAVTTAQRKDGKLFYTRSEFISGSWSTIIITADRQDKIIMDVVASSISLDAKSKLSIPSYGKLHEIVTDTLDILKEEQTPSTSTVVENQPVQSTGSGFVVSETGHILTNQHVIDKCQNITVDGINATVKSISKDLDLAILEVKDHKNFTPAEFSTDPTRLNSDVTAIGYPLSGFLGGINVTRDSVSSLSGLYGNATEVQITAPIQPGNSGGPLLDKSGRVMGVVVATLNSTKMLKERATLPQNVNFAIRGELAWSYLLQNGIRAKLSLEGRELSSEDLAERAKNFTVFIKCQ